MLRLYKQPLLNACIVNFFGLKSQIFITVEFILRRKPIPAHLPERQNNSCIENLFFIKLRYEGCNGSKKYRISFIQFVLIWIELSVTKNFQQSIISNNYLSFNLFRGCLKSRDSLFFIGYCDKNRKKIFAGMFVFCIFISVNQ